MGATTLIPVEEYLSSVYEPDCDYEDRGSRLTRQLDDYSTMSCPNIWIIDPVRSKAYRYEGETVSEVHDALCTTDSRIVIQLVGLWQ